MSGLTKAVLEQRILDLTEKVAVEKVRADNEAKRRDMRDAEARAIDGCVHVLDSLPKESGSYAYRSNPSVDPYVVRRVLLYLGERYGAGIQVVPSEPPTAWNDEVPS